MCEQTTDIIAPLLGQLEMQLAWKLQIFSKNISSVSSENFNVKWYYLLLQSASINSLPNTHHCQLLHLLIDSTIICSFSSCGFCDSDREQTPVNTLTTKYQQTNKQTEQNRTKLNQTELTNVHLHFCYDLLSRVHSNLSILSSRHNTNTVSLHVEMFLTASSYLILNHVVTRLKRRLGITAGNAVPIRRTFVERVLCNCFLAHALSQNWTRHMTHTELHWHRNIIHCSHKNIIHCSVRHQYDFTVSSVSVVNFQVIENFYWQSVSGADVDKTVYPTCQPAVTHPSSNQPLLQLRHIPDWCLVHTLLHNAPDTAAAGWDMDWVPAEHRGWGDRTVARQTKRLCSRRRRSLRTIALLFLLRAKNKSSHRPSWLCVCNMILLVASILSPTFLTSKADDRKWTDAHGYCTGLEFSTFQLDLETLCS